jgi:predicted DNA-binding protein (MmcQ/YjbR family)
MTLETLRTICRAMPDVTEDIKWGADLVFSIGGRMFCVVNTEPPHQMSFKCTPDAFGELVERPGLKPAPYLARAMWVQEESLGETLERAELERLLRTSYELVRAKAPKGKLSKKKAMKSKKANAVRRSRADPAAARRRRR